MKKLLLLLLGVTLTFTTVSCSKETTETPQEQVQANLQVRGTWATLVTLADGTQFYYGLDFGNNQNTVEGFFALVGDNCATYDGFWTVSNRTATSLVLNGGGSSRVTVSYVNQSTLSINGYTDLTGDITGSMSVQSFSVCSGKRVMEPGTLSFDGGDGIIDDDQDTVILHGGTRVVLQMTETISSDRKGGRKVNTGDLILLTVAADVTDIDGNVLISSGTSVNGIVTNARKRKAAGTKGKLSISVTTIRAVDGSTIPVQMNYNSDGDSKVGVAVGAAAVVALPLLLIKGKPAVIPAGTTMQALTISNRKIQI